MPSSEKGLVDGTIGGIGTYDYMAPEQWGQALDLRADGVVGFRLNW